MASSFSGRHPRTLNNSGRQSKTLMSPVQSRQLTSSDGARLAERCHNPTTFATLLLTICRIESPLALRYPRQVVRVPEPPTFPARFKPGLPATRNHAVECNPSPSERWSPSSRKGLRKHSTLGDKSGDGKTPRGREVLASTGRMRGRWRILFAGPSHNIERNSHRNESRSDRCCLAPLYIRSGRSSRRRLNAISDMNLSAKTWVRT